jgi:asparagine synthase (glutamine-hydrolysing)
MPGLAALLIPKCEKTIAQNIIDMAESMCHESFYKKEIFNDGSTPFVASRVHLDILNREPQPIYNENSTILIMMDGELRARDSLREKLISARHKMRTYSDAELLLHLYEDKGTAFVHDLKGWFLALIHDIKRARTLIINDCFGIYRAYYTKQGDTLIVASEIKSILKYRQASFRANEDKFSEYFLYDAILNDETLFKDIHRLPPASLWIYEDGTLTKNQYFDFSTFSEEISLGKEEFHEEANRIFKKVMPEYVTGDRIGLSLTGGWDSRTELATITHLGYSLPCYTWCGPYGESLDVKFGRRAAQIADQEYHVFYLGQDFFDNFSEYAQKTIYFSDASADIFKAHELYFNRLSRSVSTIRLTGKHGSHTMSRGPLGRDLLHPYMVNKRIFSKMFLESAGDFDNYVYKAEPGSKWIIDAIRWLWLHGFTAIETTQLIMRCPFVDEEIIELLLKAPEHYLNGRSVQKYIVQNNYPPLAGIPSNRADYIKPDKTLKNMKLKALSLYYGIFDKMDRAYLHPAVPHKFVKMDPFMKATRLEKIFLGSSLLLSTRRWIKVELRTFFQEMLLDERTLSRPYLDPQFIKQLTLDHFGNTANYTREIGKIISLEMWHRLFVD